MRVLLNEQGVELDQLTIQPKIEPIPFSTEQLQWLSSCQQLVPVLRSQIIDKALSAISLSEEDQLQAMGAFCEERGLKTPEEVESFCSQQLIFSSHLRSIVERPMRLARLCERDYLPKAEARFLERKTSLDQVIYSLIRVGEPWLARELFLRIESKEADFALLASEYSQGNESKTRGVVGPVPMLQAHPELARRLRTSPPGLVLEPFQIEQWWLIVRVENYNPAVLDEATRMAMAKEIFEEWLQAEVRHQFELLAPQLRDENRIS
jgi:parvulin-like peptidyl-prolyl isomerase